MRSLNTDTLFECEFKVDAHVVKKNGRDIFINKATGKHFLGKSSRLKIAENYLIAQFRHFWWLFFNKDKKPISKFVNVQIIFYFDEDHFFTAKGRVNKKIPDISNLYQIVEDALEKAGVLENDHFIASHNGSFRMPFKGENKLYVKVTQAPIQYESESKN